MNLEIWRPYLVVGGAIGLSCAVVTLVELGYERVVTVLFLMLIAWILSIGILNFGVEIYHIEDPEDGKDERERE